MNKLILPAQINPPTIRKDGSIKLSFDSRELTAEEYMMVMGFRHSEGWLAYQPNEMGVPELPSEPAEVESKSPSKRQYDVIYILFKQAEKEGTFVGLFDTYYKQIMEGIIGKLKDKIHD